MTTALITTDSQPSSSKLAIRHVLLWMACISVVAGWHSSSYSLSAVRWPLQAHQLLAASSYSILAGLALAGLALAIACALRGRQYYPRTGGHWLLTANGLVIICSETNNWITDTWHDAHPELQQTEIASHVMAYSFAVTAVIFIFSAVFVCDSVAWRLVFVGCALPCVFWSIANSIQSIGDADLGYRLGRIGHRIQWPWQWGLAILVVVLSVIDLYRHKRRDWLHWTGVLHKTAQTFTQSLLIAVHSWIT